MGEWTRPNEKPDPETMESMGTIKLDTGPIVWEDMVKVVMPREVLNIMGALTEPMGIGRVVQIHEDGFILVEPNSSGELEQILESIKDEHFDSDEERRQHVLDLIQRKIDERGR